MAPPTRPRIVIGLDAGKSAHWARVVTRDGEVLASEPVASTPNIRLAAPHTHAPPKPNPKPTSRPN